MHLLLACLIPALFDGLPQVSGRNRTMAAPPAPPCDDADADADADLRRRLRDGTTLDADERVCTVEGGSNVPTATGHPRREVRLDNLWHRATYVIVRHEEGGGGNDAQAALAAALAAADDDDDEAVHLLVQRRSMRKDYCPGRLDPVPGGVVGFGEACHDNARRELQEEMGIDTSVHPMRRLFAFPYEDGRVRCWGELYEVRYSGGMEDITCQEEEVEEVLRMSLADLRRAAAEPDGGGSGSPGSGGEEWMPDGMHALRLYLQHRQDARVGRRLIRNYRGGNLEAYALRPRPRAIFFDCDDCLYFDGWQVAARLTERIEAYCVGKVGLPEGEAYRLYKEHGTALRGLLARGLLEDRDGAIDGFLRDVHDLPIGEMLGRDEELRDMLLRMDPAVPRYVFTASVRDHAERCLEALGIADLFVDIIDVRSCGLATKHSERSFRAAMRVAGISDGDEESCLLLDDSVTNLEAARRVGWRGVLVGTVGRDCGTRVSSEHAELELGRIHALREAMPELFSPP